MGRFEDFIEGETSTTSQIACKKQKSSEDNQEDRISNLPDSILLHILSFLPMKDVVRTVLLRRFGNLWASVHTLDFDGRSYLDFSKARYNWWFREFVEHVLLFHECPTIHKFSLKFGSYLYFSPCKFSRPEHRKPVEPNFASEIDLWIRLALGKKVQVFELGILAHGSSSIRFDYDLPKDVFMSESIVELKLVNICLRQQEQVHLKSLRTLSLTTIMLNDQMIEGILNGCPLLESLSLIQCCDLQKLNCTSANLTKLMIVLGDNELLGLEISGPNLVSLNISGLNGQLHLKNLSSLCEATLDLCFTGACVANDYSNFGSQLEGLHHANTFTISSWCILMLSFWEEGDFPCSSSVRKHLILKTGVTKRHLPGIARLLKNSPRLEMLTINQGESTSFLGSDDDVQLRVGISGVHEENFWNDETWLDHYDLDVDHYFESQPPFSCLRNHLKTVKILRGGVSNSSLLQLVKFLLGSSAVLERMEISITSYPSATADILAFWEKVLSYPKASTTAIIVSI